MTREEHIDLIRRKAADLSEHKRWQDLANDLATLRGICMTFMVQLNLEYIETIAKTIPVPDRTLKLTVDDL